MEGMVGTMCVTTAERSGWPILVWALCSFALCWAISFIYSICTCGYSLLQFTYTTPGTRLARMASNALFIICHLMLVVSNLHQMANYETGKICHSGKSGARSSVHKWMYGVPTSILEKRNTRPNKERRSTMPMWDWSSGPLWHCGTLTWYQPCHPLRELMVARKKHIIQEGMWNIDNLSVEQEGSDDEHRLIMRDVV